MGITVNESLTLESGIVIDSYFASLTSRIEVMKEVTNKFEQIPGRDPLPHNVHLVERRKYKYVGAFNQYLSKEAKNSGKRPVGSETLVIESDEALTGDIYKLFYDEFKSKHPSYLDEI